MTFFIVFVIFLATSLLVAFSMLPALKYLASGSLRLERKAIGDQEPELVLSDAHLRKRR